MDKYAKDDLSAAYFIRAQRKRDALDLLRALDAAQKSTSPAAPFNRALAQEKLGLLEAARNSWNQVAADDDSQWAKEARDRLEGLSRPAPQWRQERLQEALRLRDRASIDAIVRGFPAEAEKYFEESVLLDPEGSRLLANALGSTGDTYPHAIIEAAEHTKTRDALDRGMRAFQEARRYERQVDLETAAPLYTQAAVLLERAGNPLSLAARYGIAACRFHEEDVLPLLDPIVVNPHYRNLASRIHTLRAGALESMGRYTEALTAYSRALAASAGNPKVWTRRSMNYLTIGQPEKAFRDALHALTDTAPSDFDTRHQANAGAAAAAWRLGYPKIALQYQTAAVFAMRQAVPSAGERAKHHLSIALRARAQFYAALDNDAAASVDLDEAAKLADALNSGSVRALLAMRVAEVRGLLLMKTDPTAAVAQLTRALDLATGENETYRAELYVKRAGVRRIIGDHRAADEDIAAALELARREATVLRAHTPRGEFEDLWKPYFLRFQSKYHEIIERRIAARDYEGAFLYTEEERAFEPMQLLLQSKPVPPGFHKIRTKDDLHRALAELPADTVILQYLVVADKTYTWTLTRERVGLSVRSIGSTRIAAWVSRFQEFRDYWPATPAEAVYEGLFEVPLRNSRHTTIVIVPDGPMHGLPFAALRDAASGKYLIERGSIAVAGSTSLYLYAMHRDHQFRAERKPPALIVGDPTVTTDVRKRYNLAIIRNAPEEARQLSRDYAGAELLMGSHATSKAFLDAAQKATIIHFAGHGVANSENPWLSMLAMAPDGDDTGELTAEKLLTEVDDLDRTRLIVLAACSTASGDSIGPEGVAPLVRPLIAARVPAVVGTLWDVADVATLEDLFVSLHCHYRNGDDVAVALQKAQLEMLREPPRTWAPIQVFGYARSPYAHHDTMEKTPSEHLCSQDSLHRPDGLHSQ